MRKVFVRVYRPLLALLLLGLAAPKASAAPQTPKEVPIAFRILHTAGGRGEVLPCG